MAELNGVYREVQRGSAMHWEVSIDTLCVVVLPCPAEWLLDTFSEQLRDRSARVPHRAPVDG